MRTEATFSRPADNTTYATGDAIANSLTGSAVVPMTFKLGVARGLLISATCVVTPASGSLIVAGLDFDLLLFRPGASIPFADGSYIADNSQMAISAAARRDFVAKFAFVNGMWENEYGAYTGGLAGWQASVPAIRPVIEFHTYDSGNLIGVVQAKGAWSPTAIINRFDFSLEASPLE